MARRSIAKRRASYRLSAEEAVERNLATVDAQFHSEIQQDIDQAIDLYGDSIVWGLPPAACCSAVRSPCDRPISTFSSRCTSIPSTPSVGS
jgi:hypothetical protein